MNAGDRRRPQPHRAALQIGPSSSQRASQRKTAAPNLSANLTSARLLNADFTNADLRSANLTNADLTYAIAPARISATRISPPPIWCSSHSKTRRWSMPTFLVQTLVQRTSAERICHTRHGRTDAFALRIQSERANSAAARRRFHFRERSRTARPVQAARSRRRHRSFW